MARVRTILLCISALLFALSCMAADNPDSRLDKKVSIQSIGQPLASFSMALGMQAGITIKADKGVAEYKVTVLAKDLPISRILSGVAEALHIKFRSVKDSKGTYTYEFYEEPASKKKADELYIHERSGLRRQMDHAADTLRLDLSAEELEKKIAADALLQPYIGEKDFRTAVEVYSSLPEKDRNTFWEVGALPVALDKLPESTRAKVVALFDRNREQREQTDNVKLTDAAASVLFEWQDDPLAGRSLSFHVVGTGNHGLTYMFMQVQEGDPDLLGNDEFFTLKENKETGEYMTDAGKIPEKLTADSGVELTETTMTEALQRLHEATGVSIIADQYTPRYTSQAYVDKWAITRGESIAHEVEKIAEVFMCKWKYTGDACIMWSKTWFEDRKVEIPLTTVQRWQSARQKTLRFELPELVEMALLSDKQQKTFRYYGITVPDSFFTSVRGLRFYDALAPTERSQAASAEGLLVDKLADDQKQALTHWILSPAGPERKPSQFTAESINGARVRIYARGSEWVFEIRTPDGRMREDILRLS